MIVSNHERARYYMHVGREHLDADERAILEKHLDACPECRAYAVELGALQTHLTRAMRAGWLGQHPRSAMTRVIQARLARNDRLRHFMSSVGALVAAAGALGVVAILGWLLMTTGSFDAGPSASASPPRAVAGPSTPAASPDPVLEEPSASGAAHRPLRAVFADYATLTGVDVSRVRVSPGDALTATLYWRISPVPAWAPFNVVVHVLDDGGHSVAHSDSIASRAPRTQFVQQIADRHVLALADMLPAGSYRLVASTYLTDVGLFPSSTEGTVSVLLAIIQVE
jgi:predicted anti-sigma-YlaC factor YlaD